MLTDVEHNHYAREVFTMRTIPRKQSMLEKGLEIIELLAEAGRPMTVAEISETLKMPRPTVYRLIQPLEDRGYVSRTTSRNEYTLWLKCLHLGEIVRNSMELRRLAYPFMQDLRDEVGLAVHLVIRDQTEAVYVEKVESHHPVRLFTQIGRRVPLHVTACPRVLLAYRSDDEIEEYLANISMVKYTSTTVADPETLWNCINAIRQNGYSVAFGELEPKTAAVAVPIFDYRGVVVASLSVAGPEWYFEPAELNHLVRSLRSCAHNISQGIGYNGGKNVQ